MATSKHDLLDQLFQRAEIDLKRGALFDARPGDPLYPEALGGALEPERLEGMFLGLAIGDALGATTAGMRPGEREAAHGELRNYLPGPGGDADASGRTTFISQLTFDTLEQMLRNHGRMRPGRVARHLARRDVHEPPEWLRQVLMAASVGDEIPWWRCGARVPNGGAMMRIAPVVPPHVAEGGPALWRDAALLALVTHQESAAIAAAIAMAGILHALLGADKPPSADWWSERFVTVAREVELDPFHRARSPELEGWQGPVWRFVQQQLPRALEDGLTSREASRRFGSGNYVLECAPIALFILARHADDPEEALVRAVNDSVASSTVGAVVGAAIGALHGLGALPERWLRGLDGRLGGRQDQRLFELVDDARLRWAEPIAPDVERAGP